MSTAITLPDPVEAYLDDLGRALSGPRRRKADLLAEARDSLVDATEAFEAEGLSPAEAKQAAVEDFGALADVVPGYRAELGIAQGRRTAVTLCLVMLAQPIVWKEGVWAWTQEPDSATALTAFLDDLVMVVGLITIVGSILALAATGLGLRYPLLRDRATRVTAQFALACCAMVGAISICMGLFNTDCLGLLSSELNSSGLAGAAVVAGFVLLPLTVVARSATRCLRLV